MFVFYLPILALIVIYCQWNDATRRWIGMLLRTPLSNKLSSDIFCDCCPNHFWHPIHFTNCSRRRRQHHLLSPPKFALKNLQPQQAHGASKLVGSLLPPPRPEIASTTTAVAVVCKNVKHAESKREREREREREIAEIVKQ
jgi:hypothetical protein